MKVDRASCTRYASECEDDIASSAQSTSYLLLKAKRSTIPFLFLFSLHVNIGDSLDFAHCIFVCDSHHSASPHCLLARDCDSAVHWRITMVLITSSFLSVLDLRGAAHSAAGCNVEVSGVDG